MDPGSKNSYSIRKRRKSGMFCPEIMTINYSLPGKTGLKIQIYIHRDKNFLGV